MLLLSSLMIFVLLLFAVLLFHKGRHKTSNVALGLYLIGQFLGLIDGILYNLPVEWQMRLTHLSLVFMPVMFTWGASYYLYISSVLDNNFRWKKIQLIHLIPFVIVFVYLTVNFYIKPANVKWNLLKTQEIYNLVWKNFWGLYNVLIIGYVIASVVRYYNFIRWSKDEYSSLDRVYLMWIKISLFGFLIACSIVQVGNYLVANNIIVKPIVQLICNFTFLVFYCVLFYTAISNPIILKAEERKKYKSSLLTPQEAQLLLNKLESFMREHCPHRNSLIGIKDLSVMVNIPERHLSQIINEYKGQNFFDFINSYRVLDAKQMLTNPSNNKKTMLEILFDSGFNSKTAFNTAFKKYTGHTPSYYREKSCVD
jgi:AraC-like DNA-binding protein